MDKPNRLKRPLLYALVVSVLCGALLGIAAVLRNHWGWLEIRVLLTTVTVAVASLCGLACELSRTPRGANLLPSGGLLLTLVATTLLLVAIWSDPDTELYWKATAIVCIFAVATVHTCLLSIARLSGKFAWVFFLTCQVIYGLAVLLSVMIVWDLENDRMIQCVLIVSILDAALTIIIPLLHRISKTDDHRTDKMTPLEERNVAAIDQEIYLLKQQLAELEKLRDEITGSRVNEGRTDEP